MKAIEARKKSDKRVQSFLSRYIMPIIEECSDEGRFEAFIPLYGHDLKFDQLARAESLLESLGYNVEVGGDWDVLFIQWDHNAH